MRRVCGWRSGVAAVGVAVFALAPEPCAAADASWRIADGDVVILVPLKPGGSFEARTASLAGELIPGSGRPLALAGEVTVDLTSVTTGIALRDRHLRERLEVSRGGDFAEARLSEIALSGADGPGFRGKTGFEGTLLLHGVGRTVKGDAEILAAGAGVRVEAEFVLDLPEFGIDAPRYMGVGVANKVIVKVAFDARPAGSGR